MITKRIRSFCEWLVLQEHSSKKFALSVCMGIYIAFSPFVGLHTVMTILFSRLFALNVAVLFAISVLINNPWTMVPVYGLGHFFGSWIFSVFNIDAVQLDPVWLEGCNYMLKEHTGISGLSLSAFLVGGNMLGIIVSVLLYPCIKYVFSMYLRRRFVAQ